MPISTLWAKSMPSILSRKPWTKCCRACSPSVTMSTPESSCSFTASRVASRLARESSAPDDFQGAHSVFGSASHSGFGSEPAMVVGNSMGASRDMWLSACLPCLMVEVQNYKSVVQPDDDRDSEIKIGNPNDRILLRLLQPLDLSRLPQHPAAGKGVFRGDRLAADFGRRHLQYHQSERLCDAGQSGPSQTRLPEKGHGGLGTLGR